jgi:nitroreductase
MHVLEAIEKRRSIRKFKKQEIKDEYINLLIYAASLAPCAGNTQEWRFIIVKDEKKKEELAKASYNQLWMKDAPVIIAICADEEEIGNRYGSRGKKMYMYIDCALAAENLILLAQSLGLGTCIVGAFDDEEISRILKLPKNVKPIMLIPVGYPAEEPEKPFKKDLEDITFINEYGKK